MKSVFILLMLAVLLPFASGADENRHVGPLPCGIYDQSVSPLIEKDLETQHPDRANFTMEARTKSGRILRVEVQSVAIRLPGERNHVSVFVDGKPMAKTSHQDVPLYLEVHVDQEKYRVICVRGEQQDVSRPTGSIPGR